VSHSDGDVLLHALTDAILGALGEGDIGQLFPDDDPRNEGAASSRFVAEAVRRMHAKGLAIGNVDLTVICQRPKLADRRIAIITRVAELLGCAAERVNLKGKTHEEVDAVGEGRAIEAVASVLLVPELRHNPG